MYAHYLVAKGNARERIRKAKEMFRRRRSEFMMEAQDIVRFADNIDSERATRPSSALSDGMVSQGGTDPAQVDLDDGQNN